MCLSAGTFDRAQATVRHGGSFGSARLSRVFAVERPRWNRPGQRRGRRRQLDALTNGVRVDWERDHDDFMVDGSARIGDMHATWLLPTTGVPDRAANRGGVLVSDRKRPGPLDASRRGRLLAAGTVGRRVAAPDRDASWTRDDLRHRLQYHMRPAGVTTWSPAAATASSRARHGTSYPFSLTLRLSGPRLSTCSPRTRWSCPAGCVSARGRSSNTRPFSGWGRVADGARDVGPRSRAIISGPQRHAPCGRRRLQRPVPAVQQPSWFPARASRW